MIHPIRNSANPICDRKQKEENNSLHDAAFEVVVSLVGVSLDEHASLGFLTLALDGVLSKISKGVGLGTYK